MNKKNILFLIAVILIFSAGETFAFTNVSKSTITATAEFSSAGTVYANIQLRNLADNNTTNQIWWDPANITLGSTKWRRSDAYILIDSTITSATGGIQIYTYNTNSAAIPKYVGVSSNCAGLVAQEVPSADPLPMCWRITDTSTTTLTIDETAGSPSYLYSTELGSSYHCFLFMKDAGSIAPYNINMGDSYITVKEAFSGIQQAENTWSYNLIPRSYIYIGAKFIDAVSGRTYKTSTLRIELFTE